MKINVPYISFDNSRITNAAVATDGITCAKMIMDYYGFKTTEDMRELLAWGNCIGACDKIHSVMLDSLVVLLQVKGFYAYKEVFKNISFDFVLSNAIHELYDREYRENGITAIVSSISESIPVIALVNNGNETIDEEHVVLLIGYEASKGELKGLYYHDPASDQSGESQFISMDDFRNAWRRTAIFLDK